VQNENWKDTAFTSAHIVALLRVHISRMCRCVIRMMEFDALVMLMNISECSQKDIERINTVLLIDTSMTRVVSQKRSVYSSESELLVFLVTGGTRMATKKIRSPK
jgi:hypothetical protein